MAATPRVFCAVSAVTTEAPKTPSAAKLLRSAWMPAPPDESEPAMVSAIGIVIAHPASAAAVQAGSCAVLARPVIASKFLGAILRLTSSGDDNDGSLLRPDQVQARPVLHRCERACGSRDCLGDLFHRRRLRPAGQVLCR